MSFSTNCAAAAERRSDEQSRPTSALCAGRASIAFGYPNATCKGTSLDPNAAKREESMRNRNIQIKLWVNDEEYKVLQQDVERTGLTQSKYLRALIMKRPIREKLPIDYYHMLTELSRIGNNLNQIARIANQQPDKVPTIDATLTLIQTLYRTTVDIVDNINF